MNFPKLKKLFALILTFVMVATIAAPIGANAASTWTPKSDTRIFWVETADSNIANEDLQAQIRLFSSEFGEKLDRNTPEIVYGEASQAGANDIILVLDKNSGVSAQGYQVTAGSSITITASNADGLFYGCRYLIKELLRVGYVSDVKDAPYVGERAVSLDNGRKYFSADWIKELIREMSWANMNALVLHFSEEMGLGIESKLYPWLAGRDGTLCVAADLGENYDGSYLRQEEIIEIVEYAKLYHIDIIPSLDSPGHMNYIVKKFNEQCANQDFSFTYRGVTYTAKAGDKIGNYFKYGNATTDVVPGSRNTTYSRGIDISNDVAVAFTKSLIEEYATLFAKLGCTKFDIGGDELLGWGNAAVSTSTASRWKQLDHWKAYAQNRAKAEGKSNYTNAVAYDAFLYYMNDLNDLVRDLGYTSVRMWNDDALRSSDTGWTGVVQLDTDIDIWYWSAGTNPYATYADAGYEIYNILDTYCYYVMKDGYYNGTEYTQARAENVYIYWNPYVYGTGGGAEWDDARVLGGAFGIWCDNPSLKDEDAVMTDILPLIRVNAAKTWYPTTDRVNYATFTANWTEYGNAPEGTTAAPEIYMIPDLTALKAAVEEYASVDGTLYTEETFAAYSSAVEAGKAVLESEKPTQAQADAAVKAIQDAKTALAEKPKADVTALNAAISDYDQVNAALYTPESFAAYTDAVDAGKKMLAGGAYTQAEVDAAVKAIQDAEDALEEKPKADVTALNQEIEAFNAVDSSVYTPESFDEYRKAVNAATELLTQTNLEQSDVDSALANIQSAKNGLKQVTASSVECILSASSKAQKGYVGKTASFSVSTKKDVAVIGLAIYDDRGNQVKIASYGQNTTKADRNCSNVTFKLTKNDRGTRTYTIYAILADGSRSADSIQLTLKVM